ncbi:thiolase family protein [Ruicaihuangia caeni]|uniref:Thiolase family protein n=1 Tax=Ruicaihuangia caeni TaxID=3042517 RepID=A0AAW6TAD5_9MICO|nr:thiolase family protein [Klugiella sp. YN-L-19]MDI2099025.1 thiolase family protein [Klugiella sp. YN-L-19]
MDAAAFEKLVTRYNRATEEHLSPLPLTGPNALFAMLTTRQMEERGLEPADYGRIAVAQRSWAGLNPGAVYRQPLSLEEYFAAPMVADPLRRYDCVPSVTGANAVVVVADDRATGMPRARVLGVTSSFNRDDQGGNGLVTGVAESADAAWQSTGVAPSDIDVLSVYDDYPAMVVAQLNDLGVVHASDTSRFIRERVATRDYALNTSGGQLSAGQAGSAGGMHGLVEVVRQLRREAGDRQAAKARIGAVTGYGMVLYRYGSCGNVTVLEAAA